MGGGVGVVFAGGVFRDGFAGETGGGWRQPRQRHLTLLVLIVNEQPCQSKHDERDQPSRIHGSWYVILRFQLP
ncbi:MAG: hypothetical protein HC933_08715 [Pleurocapsa sp. SU_196_0]|nr:hypothetical protein [Pleurocapsa sp. SU_196_0]